MALTSSIIGQLSQFIVSQEAPAAPEASEGEGSVNIVDTYETVNGSPKFKARSIRMDKGVFYQKYGIGFRPPEKNDPRASMITKFHTQNSLLSIIAAHSGKSAEELATAQTLFEDHWTAQKASEEVLDSKALDEALLKLLTDSMPAIVASLKVMVQDIVDTSIDTAMNGSYPLTGLKDHLKEARIELKKHLISASKAGNAADIEALNDVHKEFIARSNAIFDSFRKEATPLAAQTKERLDERFNEPSNDLQENIDKVMDMMNITRDVRSEVQKKRKSTERSIKIELAKLKDTFKSISDQ